MALIKCPECNEDISGKSETCIHCGYILKGKESKKCQECGSILENDISVCPKCGCPVENTNTQKVEVTKIKSPFSKKQFILEISIILIVLVLFFGGIMISKSQQKTNYQVNINEVTSKMLYGAKIAEECGGLARQVWHDTIYKESNIKTLKYTQDKYGTSFNPDFNKSLENLYSDKDFIKKITSIKENQDEVDKIMKKLINPPAEYKEVYSALKEFYDNYYSLTELAINPSGSYQIYSNNFNQADSDTFKGYNKIKKYINY